MPGYRLTVGPDEAGLRLDRFIANSLPDISRAKIQAAIAHGNVLVNGKAVPKDKRLAAGDEIEFQPLPPETLNLTPESIPLDVIYEDDCILVINKPVGMTVHPAPGSQSGTLVHALLGRQTALSDAGEPFRPGIVHRLDKETAGLIIVAKTNLAHWRLAQALQARRIHRAYLSICIGEPTWKTATVDKPIGRHPKNRQKMAIVPNGRPAKTDFYLLTKGSGMALLLAELHTGRTHQVRVHAASLGHPLVGDPLYAKGESGGQALLAWRLQFRHPTSGGELRFRAPIPPKMQALIDEIDPTWEPNDIERGIIKRLDNNRLKIGEGTCD
ncbi:MAG: RluA family pseudouridine synthase [Armatimonadetes bacterium]|nr:RluA family pseudouridine synthase [Armatimonadota bacterium]